MSQIGVMTRRVMRTAALLSVAAAAHASPYHVEVFTLPGQAGLTLMDINNKGVIVGTDFTFANGVASFLPLPSGAVGQYASGISDTGVIAGSYYTTTETDPATGDLIIGPYTAYTSSGGNVTSYVIPGVSNASLRGISPDGRFLSGLGENDQGGVGFVYDRSSGQAVQLGGPRLTIAQGINSSGLLVGSERLSTTGSPKVGFTYDVFSGVRHDYSFAGYVGTNFRDITSDGRIAGWLDTGVVVNPDMGLVHTVGFVGTAEAFDVIEVQGAVATYVEGINDQGVVVGNYVNADGTGGAFVARPVPEPSTLALTAAGLFALARKRRRSAL